MFEQERQPVRRRRPLRVGRRLLVVFGAALGRVADLVASDVHTLRTAGRLMIGLVLVLVGLLSFASDRYCDGTTSSYAACTRPSTYYYYPWWAIALVVVGALSITVWVLRKQR